MLYDMVIGHPQVENIETKTNTIIEPGTTIALLVAFPFYFIIYYLNKMAIKKITAPDNKH